MSRFGSSGGASSVADGAGLRRSHRREEGRVLDFPDTTPVSRSHQNACSVILGNRDAGISPAERRPGHGLHLSVGGVGVHDAEALSRRPLDIEVTLQAAPKEEGRVAESRHRFVGRGDADVRPHLLGRRVKGDRDRVTPHRIVANRSSVSRRRLRSRVGCPHRRADRHTARTRRSGSRWRGSGRFRRSHLR